MKRVEDFNEFLSDHVNINQSRLDKLNDHVAAVTTHLSRHLESYEKVERQGSYALRTIIKPKENREYDADVLLFMKYQPGKKPADLHQRRLQLPQGTRDIPGHTGTWCTERPGA